MTPIVGPGNVSSQVNIDIDFTTLEVTEDRVLPEDVAILSQQISRDEEVSSRAQGIRGLLQTNPLPRVNFTPADEMQQPADAQNAATDETNPTDPQNPQHQKMKALCQIICPHNQEQLRQIAGPKWSPAMKSKTMKSVGKFRPRKCHLPKLER